MKIEIQLDKFLYVLCGFICALLVSSFSDPYTGFIVTALAGVAKEVYDHFDCGKFDKLDLLAIVCGGLLGTVYFISKYM